MSLHTVRSTLHIYTLHSTLYTLPSKLCTLQFTLHNAYFALHTPHSTRYTLHTTLGTLHSSHSTLDFTLYTLNSSLLTAHFTLHTAHFTLHTLHFTLYTFHSRLYTPHFTFYTVHTSLHSGWKIVCYATLYTPHSTLHTPHSTLHTFRSTLHTLHFTLDTPDFTLDALHFTLYTLPFTLYARHFTLFTAHSPHNSQSPPPTVMILSLLVHRLLEAQTICSTFGIVILALQPFATPSSVSLLIPLQTLLFRTPMNAALLSATLHCTVPPQQFTLYTVHPLLQWSSARWFIVYQKPRPSAAPLELLSLLCNPSPPLPQYHFSSPCKLSCSEPLWTLLSFQPLYTVQSPHNSLHFTLSTPYCNDPQPAGSSSTRSPDHLQHLWNCYPCFATLRHPFLSITSHPLANSPVPNHNERCSPLRFGVPPLSSVFRLFSPIFLHFPLFVFSLFPAGVNGPRGNRSLPSPLCVVVHAPQKSSIYAPSTATNFEIFAPHATSTPQTP